MKKECVKENALSLREVLEHIRRLGDSKISKPLFYVICGVDAFSLVAVVALLSNFGVELIEENLSVGKWLLGLFLLSFLLGWAAKQFLKMCLSLWIMTRED